MSDEEEMLNSTSGGERAVMKAQRGNEEVTMKPRILHLLLELRDHQEELKQLKIKLEDIKY